jgi:glutathione synthase/RimK-type ligase-like ATP-grasp enzyme
VIVNRTSPSSHTRGHAGVLFYAEPPLAHYESLGVPVINPVAAYRFEKSKALQLGLFEELSMRYPRSVVVNHPSQVIEALDRVGFPLVVKPNVGGSGAGILRFVARGGGRAISRRARPRPRWDGARAGVRRASRPKPGTDVVAQ